MAKQSSKQFNHSPLLAKNPLKHWETSHKILLALVFFLIFSTVVGILTFYNLNFQSDSATANILARAQKSSGQLIPDQWNTSTGLFLLFYNLLIIPLSFFSDDQLLLRNLSVIIVMFSTISTIIYLFHKHLQSKGYLFLFVWLFSNSSAVIRYIAFEEAAYLPWIFDFFFMISLFFNSINEDFSIRNKKSLLCFLFFIFIILPAGLQNVIYYHVPLVGGILLTFFLKYKEETYENLKEKLLPLMKVLGLIILSISFASLANSYLEKLNDFQIRQDSYQSLDLMLDQYLGFLLRALGYQEGANLFSPQGILNILIVFVFATCLSCVVALFKKYKEQPYPIQVFMNISLVEIVLMVYFTFTLYSRIDSMSRYLIRPLVLLFALAGIYIMKYMMTQGFLMKLSILTCLFLFAVPNQLFTTPQVINYPENHKEQTGLSDYLLENGLTHGYGTFWQANELMVLSDFAITMGVLQDNFPIQPWYWLTLDEIYEVDYHEGKTFLLLTSEENVTFTDSISKVQLGEPVEILKYFDYYVYQGDAYQGQTSDACYIYVYDYNIALHDFKGKEG